MYLCGVVATYGHMQLADIGMLEAIWFIIPKIWGRFDLILLMRSWIWVDWGGSLPLASVCMRVSGVKT